MIEQVNFNNPLDAKGRIKVELFEDGNKVSEVKSNNFISKSMIDYMYKLAVKSLFTQRRLKNGRDFTRDLADPFQVMCLTDADHVADPENEWLMKGKLIGYALSDENYSGDDTLRGSYNISESSTDLNKVKMVFDFPTHAGNGMIKSVYFRNKNYGSPHYSSATSIKEALYKRILNTHVSSKTYKNKLYVLGVSTYSSDTKIQVYDENLNLITTHDIPITCFDFEIHNDYIYLVGSSKSGIYKGHIDDPKSATNTDKTLPDNRRGRGIIWHEEKQKFLVSSTTNTGGNGGYVTQIHEFDENLNLENSVNITSTSGTNEGGKLRYVEGVTFITSANAYYIYPLNDDYSIVTGIYAPEMSGLCFGQPLAYDGYLMPKHEISSRCLLDTPITKNSNQTMKITYEFILE